MRGIFVIGTDTGVGKTIVTAAVVLALRDRGITTGVAKPVQSGATCDDPAGDASLLARWTGVGNEAGKIARYCFTAPLAPLVAAEREGQVIDRAELRMHVETIASHHEAVVVEGAGGLFVPLGPDWTIADLAVDLQLPLIIVARAGLGTVNHTALTIEAARRRGLTALGVVCNSTSPHMDESVGTNASLIEQFTNVPVLGTMPWLGDELHDEPDGEHLAATFLKHVNIEPLVRALKHTEN